MQVRNLISVVACCLFKKRKRKSHSNFFLNSFLSWSAAGALQQISLPFQWACYDPRSARQRYVSGDHGGNEDHGHSRWRADRYEPSEGLENARKWKRRGSFVCLFVCCLFGFFCWFCFVWCPFTSPSLSEQCASNILSGFGVTHLRIYQHSFSLYN